jgi:Tfp pilus assembly protein PilN
MIYPSWLKNLTRADFVRSTGLYITPERFYLVRLRKSLTNISVVETHTRAIPAADDPAARKQALADALRSLVSFNAGRDPLYVCLSSDQVMSLEMSLPQVAGDNLSQVVNYEIERYLPFRREDVYYDYVPMGAKGDKFGVLLFATQKKQIDALLEVLGEFGARPEAVESSATSLSNYMFYCTGGLSGPALLLGGQNHDWEITAIDGKSDGWRQEAVVAFTHRLPQAEWVEGPGRELFYSSLRRGPRFFGWGNAGEFLRAVGESATYEDLTELGKAKLGGVDGVGGDPAFLPAVGAALQGLREGTFDVNLLPGTKEADRSRALYWINATLGVLLVIVLAAWALTYPIRDEMRLARLQRENQKLQPDVDALRKQETELNRLTKEIAFYSDLKQRRGVVMRVLDELSRIVPNTAYVSNLRYRENTIEMQGSADNASSLIPLLERSPVFENVAFNAPSTRGRDGKETFSIKADIEKPKPETAKSEASAEPAPSGPAKNEGAKSEPSKAEPTKAAPTKAEPSKSVPEKSELRKSQPSSKQPAKPEGAKP